MQTCARFRYLLLALMVTASHAALVSHVAAHFQPSLEQCELCVSQAHPLAAIPMGDPPPAMGRGPAGAVPPSPAVPMITAVVHPHQPRAPPPPSS